MLLNDFLNVINVLYEIFLNQVKVLVTRNWLFNDLNSVSNNNLR